jgi:hypothetical protein
LGGGEDVAIHGNLHRIHLRHEDYRIAPPSLPLSLFPSVIVEGKEQSTEARQYFYKDGPREQAKYTAFILLLRLGRFPDTPDPVCRFIWLFDIPTLVSSIDYSLQGFHLRGKYVRDQHKI